MAYLLGTDEAGYGPNLGPLVISASLWQVPDAVRCKDLAETLRLAVARTPQEAEADGRVAIGDSKALYQSGKGVGALERGVLVALAATGRQPAAWSEVWSVLAPQSEALRREIPWYAEFDRPLPIDNDPAEIEAAAAQFCRRLEQAAVRPLALRSRPVFEEPFNAAVDQYGSKGEVLSRITLELVAELLSGLERGPIRIVCDKHGGRNCYMHLLNATFPDEMIEVRGEGRERSVYQFGPDQRRIEIRFEARAECNLPTALASMASKYLRELAMMALNDFWRRRVPDLVETAGYPNDSHRFHTAIAVAQQALGIPDRRLWRSR